MKIAKMGTDKYDKLSQEKAPFLMAHAVWTPSSVALNGEEGRWAHGCTMVYLNRTGVLLRGVRIENEWPE